MKLWSKSFDHNSRIPEQFAFGKHHPEQHIELSANRNPHLAWSELPEGVQSLVLICHDTDVPSKADGVNEEGKSLSADLPRVDFYHWVLVDLPATLSEIKAGEFSDGITARGKAGPEAPHGSRQGLSNYTDWFAGDPKMAGDYFGYDGPCPPWNDEIIHHYHFTLYALDVPACAVSDKFTGPDVLQAIEGHILDQASLTGEYAINPNARNLEGQIT